MYDSFKWRLESRHSHALEDGALLSGERTFKKKDFCDFSLLLTQAGKMSDDGEIEQVAERLRHSRIDMRRFCFS